MTSAPRIEPAGASLSEIAVVREPPDVAASPLTRVRATASAGTSRAEQLGRAARRAGRALVRGGPSSPTCARPLLSRYSGQPGDLDGVVVVRQRPDGLEPIARPPTRRPSRTG